MKKRVWLLSILVICVVAGVFAATHFMGNQMSPTAVAQVKGIAVEQEEFRVSKENRRLVQSMGGTSIQLTDKQVIESLLTTKLISQEARRRGITIPEEDIDKEINFQKETIEQVDQLDEDGQWMKEQLLNKTIELRGMTEEEYWYDEKTRQHYHEAALGGELMLQMTESGEVAGMQGFFDYKQDLYDQAQDDIVYNHNLIDETNAILDEEWPL